MNSSSFSIAAQHLIHSSDVSVFALVDGLQYERHFGEGLSVQQPAAMSLFDTWPDCICGAVDHGDEQHNGFQRKALRTRSRAAVSFLDDIFFLAY